MKTLDKLGDLGIPITVSKCAKIGYSFFKILDRYWKWSNKANGFTWAWMKSCAVEKNSITYVVFKVVRVGQTKCIHSFRKNLSKLNLMLAYISFWNKFFQYLQNRIIELWIYLSTIGTSNRFNEFGNKVKKF